MGNGEAIYAAHPMPNHWNDTASSMVRYTRAKDNSAIYAVALSGFGSFPLGHDLPLACVKPAADSQIFLLGYEDEMTRSPLPVSWDWDQHDDHAVIRVPT